jgi:formamidopyrimidine-DNA glycosylase
VVGVGNIYASEVMFLAGISPRRKAGSLSRARCGFLADAIRAVLAHAIEAGGTTLQDFTAPDGSEGRYGQSHQVYGRQGLACPRCGGVISKIVQQQRSTFFCRGCQR